MFKRFKNFFVTLVSSPSLTSQMIAIQEERIKVLKSTIGLCEQTIKSKDELISISIDCVEAIKEDNERLYSEIESRAKSSTVSMSDEKFATQKFDVV